MSTATILSPNEPSVYVVGGVVHLNNITISDTAVVRAIDSAEDKLAELLRIAAIGARVGMIGETTAGAIDLTATVDRLTSTVGDTVDQAVEEIATVANDLLDAEKGKLPKAFAVFRTEIESVLGENFDPDSKKSIVGKFESMLKDAADEQTKRLNRALDPHAPESLIGRLRDDLVKTVKDETADVAKQVVDLREVLTNSAAAAAASKSMFDKTAMKGFKFEDVVHELVNEQAVHYGDVASQVGKEAGLLGTLAGDELVCLNSEDTRGAGANVVWEAKTKRLGLRKILDELSDAMANRDATVGVAVFGNVDTAPIKVPFAQYGDKAVLVIDKDEPDEGAVRLTYMWARWVARRKLGETQQAVDLDKIESLICDAIRSLEHSKQVRKCHTMAKKGIDEAGSHLDTMTREVETILNDLRVEIAKAE